MASKTTQSGEKKKRERGVDVEKITAQIDALKKAGKADLAGILETRLASYVDSADEQRAARKALKEANSFLKSMK